MCGSHLSHARVAKKSDPAVVSRLRRSILCRAVSLLQCEPARRLLLNASFSVHLISINMDDLLVIQMINILSMKYYFKNKYNCIVWLL